MFLGKVVMLLKGRLSLLSLFRPWKMAESTLVRDDSEIWNQY